MLVYYYLSVEIETGSMALVWALDSVVSAEEGLCPSDIFVALGMLSLSWIVLRGFFG